jgi:hypothetical protein
MNGRDKRVLIRRERQERERERDRTSKRVIEKKLRAEERKRYKKERE